MKIYPQVSVRHWTLAIMLVSMMSACTTTHLPKPPAGLDLDKIPDAVPKVEPRSKTGNPEFYVQNGIRYWIIPNAKGYVERGRASWYGPKFHRKRTSSGEPYDMYKMTAAHPALPLPTYAKVTNLANGRSVIVRINDRGPFKDKRIIDLSYAAAYKLGMVNHGTTEVELRVIDPETYVPATAAHQPVASPAAVSNPAATVAPNAAAAEQPTAANQAEQTRAEPATQVAAKPAAEVAVQPPEKGIFIQVGAFSNLENAKRAQDKLAAIQPHPVLISPVQGKYKTLQRVQIGPFESREEAGRLDGPLNELGFINYHVIER